MIYISNSLETLDRIIIGIQVFSSHVVNNENVSLSELMHVMILTGTLLHKRGETKSYHVSGWLKIAGFFCDMTDITPGTLVTSAAADVINHNGRKIGSTRHDKYIYIYATSVPICIGHNACGFRDYFNQQVNKLIHSLPA